MLKVGVIGLGAIGQRLIKGFEGHPDTVIAAVCDTFEERAKEVATELGGVQAFNDHNNMLEQTDLDLVYVAVPPKFHHAVASDVLAKGIHILCEKPLANSVEEAASLLKQAQDAGVVNAMNFPLNYSAGSKSFEKLINDNYVGELRRVQLKMHFPEWPRPWQQNAWVASKEQGGYVLEVGVHFIQQLQKIFGEVRVKDVQIQFPENPKASENAILAILELSDGTPVLIDGMSQIAGKEEITFTAYGTKGTLSLLNWGQLEGGKLGEEILPLELDSSLADSLIDNLVKALRGEEATIIDFAAGYEAQVVLEELRKG
ncbi:Gfo/Idh/MocA family oxidoreductase [Mesobacillus subterraneus]|uniref:Gfo/Idh/MocA family protein n=1 Tax=Mesobacillus subterraneus TaxID=285983 RepID=UPI00203DC5F7|nr:Gfo/Idh/MocA family oxidoreductase [Mesobacillus subterraneus]MCM3666856.1 Gfo/Idh/MocA family oxidoreductase [Mesobacillus subterraneus]MCM3684969.1 Gfo/Idh/MocA family oxidoreductase [Mesobacillus subterraneus]